jgi:hypothetical protein
MRSCHGLMIKTLFLTDARVNEFARQNRGSLL